MAVQQRNRNSELNSYLSPNQQDLLLAALNSQAGGHAEARSTVALGQTSGHSTSLATDDQQPTMSATTVSPQFTSPQDVEFDSFNAEYSPDLDYMDGDGNFDFENADLGGEMIGALPGNEFGGVAEQHEKRKNPDDAGTNEEGDSKRQETQEGEKGAKKPGRKPLTSEPTTKRKAQNRAAQRAFRERKEKHLKDLETQVTDLTKAQEADKHENGLLKAQVERLQTEVREYKKRLSQSSVSRSPTFAGSNGPQRSASGPNFNGNFQFDFPKFGALPGSQIFGNQGVTASPSPSLNQRSNATSPTGQSPSTYGVTTVSRENSGARSMSPTSARGSIANVDSPAQTAGLDPAFAAYSTNNNMHGFVSTLPQMNGASDPFGDLFSPSILKSANVDGYFNGTETTPNTTTTPPSYTVDNGGDSTAGLNRVFQFNGGSSVSDSTSPSASSTSQWNANGTGNSSCGTSPEPSYDSPSNTNLGVPSTTQQRSETKLPKTENAQANTAANMGFGNPGFGLQSEINFDPMLFGDYRESQDAIVGGGEFNNGFFDDAFNNVPLDFGSPSNLFGILQSPQQTHSSLNNTVNPAPAPSKNLMAEIDKTRDGGDDDYGLPQTQKVKDAVPQLISCNNIWNQLQSNPDFQEGKFDLDGLCSELRVKARCSESGVMVDQKHVDAALRKLAQKDEQQQQNGKHDVPPLMFEAASWENVLKKMGKNGQI